MIALHRPFADFASANFSYHTPTVTVISPVTDKVYDYSSSIPLSVKVEMYPHSVLGLGAEELAEVRYSIDGQPEKNARINNEVPQSRYCTGYANATISGLSRGIHKLFIRGHTNFGDFSSPSVGFNRTVYFIVGSISATIKVISPQQTTYNSNTVPLNFTCYKPLTWAGYSLDKNLISDCLDKANINNLSHGTHSLRIYGTDGSGNNYASQSIVFSINDKSTPVVTIDIDAIIDFRKNFHLDFGNMTYWHLVFHVNEPTSWMSYSMDGGAKETIEGNTSLKLSYGTHSITVYAADACGNVGASTPYTFTLTQEETRLAHTPPNPSPTPSPSPNANNAAPSNQTLSTAIIIIAGIMLAPVLIVLFYFRKNQKRMFD